MTIKAILYRSTLKGELNWIMTLSLLLIITFIVRFYVVFKYEINWDEFYYLSFVYKYLQSNLNAVLQTFHVHFFTWLDLVSDNEVVQIIVARLVMLVMQFVTCCFIYVICRLYVSRLASLFSVFSYLSFSYVLLNGASFRTDPIATLCMMVSVYYLLAKKFSIANSILVGGVIAFSTMITIKSSIYFPTLVVIAILMFAYSKNFKKNLGHFTVLVLSAVTLFCLFFYLHQINLGGDALRSGFSIASEGLGKTVTHGVFVPGKIYLVYSVVSNAGFWLMVLCGVITICSSVLSGNLFTKKDSLIILSLVFPLLSVLVYRNAFPYYYVFVLAPTSVFCGIAWDSIMSSRHSKVIYFVLASMFLSVVVNGLMKPYEKGLHQQQMLIDVVHKAFPDAVPYIDRCSMISSYPQVGFFMSSWGMENYFLNGNKVLTENITKYQPPFLIANIHYLDVKNDSTMVSKVTNSLIDFERKTIQENYIHHWGALYVAGKSFELKDAHYEKDFNMVIGGTYTLESISAVEIDGEYIEPGQAIYLNSGDHIIRAIAKAGKYTLRWGGNIYKPDLEPVKYNVFNGF